MLGLDLILSKLFLILQEYNTPLKVGCSILRNLSRETVSL